MFAAINKKTAKSPTNALEPDLFNEEVRYRYAQKRTVPWYVGTVRRYLVRYLVRYASKIKLKYGTLVRYRPNYEVRSTQIIIVP